MHLMLVNINFKKNHYKSIVNNYWIDLKEK